MVMQADEGGSKTAKLNTKPNATRRGRPKGAKTAERQPVTVTREACRHCGAITKPVNVHNTRRVAGSGRTPDGRVFGAVVFSNANCGNCGKPIMLRDPELIPE